MQHHTKAFTLVELAIVMTIIGLLIGGVLKGQELLQNARMTSTAAQVKSYGAGVMTFRDVYKAFPGDLRDPANFIQGCTTAPCNISGDANGIVGLTSTWASDENNNFWLHLAKANLISGVDPNATWTSGNYFVTTAPLPPYPLGGRLGLVHLGTSWNGRTMVSPHYFHSFSRSFPLQADISNQSLAKYDLKIDDGKATSGAVILHSSFVTAANGTDYDPNLTTNAQFLQSAEF